MAHVLFRRHAVALASLLAAHGGATAQTTITVTGRSEPVASVSGFGGSLATAPLQASVLDAAALRDAGVAALSGITQFDAGVADAYNAAGYWSGLAMRGFVVDARANHRRDGLPINAETSLSLVNKDRVELLKGTSGIQAGTSAPGGLVNLVVKRPVDHLREVALDWSERATVAATVDLSQRFGEGRYGARLNAETAALRPQLRNADGQRGLLALAVDWLPVPESRLEFEIERSRQSQPSAPGFSLLGDRLPDAKSINPRTNLNDQPWSLPVVLDGDTASLRWQQRLGDDWSLTLHGASQRLRSQDRVAFPFGCSNEADTYYADRYCPDGSFDLYDFRSENERRRTDAVDVQLRGSLSTGAVHHRLTAGALSSRVENRFQRAAYNFVGAGSIDGGVVTPPDPSLTDDNTDRDEGSRELYVRDAMQLGERWQLWTGLRFTRIHRQSLRTDGTQPIDYTQSFSVPWLAAGYAPARGVLAYASWGRGVESEVVPNRSRYRNAGQALPALQSRQVEAGIKVDGASGDASASVFEIRRPAAQDFCAADDDCERRIDGAARHRGLELAGGLRDGPWTLRGSALWLQVRREGSADAALDGMRPTNVPDRSLKARLSRRFGDAATVQVDLIHEGRRSVLPDDSLELAGWTRVDAALGWRLPVDGGTVRLRLGVDNLFDRRAWRESPTQFGHVYLMALAPRTLRASLVASF